MHYYRDRLCLFSNHTRSPLIVPIDIIGVYCIGLWGVEGLPTLARSLLGDKPFRKDALILPTPPLPFVYQSLG